MGWSHDGPAETAAFHLPQQAHRQEGLATAGKATEDEGKTSVLLLQPVGESLCGLVLILGEAQFSVGK
ncbi:MAG: Uncharacterised protein [Synechococcus sp. MIT S9220]|nr:MAG: Uncharacterised protein [Synechococcus sp. MIT S9220]